ncbi:MAG: PD-(D/E)XK nuclease family protein [Deltaproteobacteria bacterium]|nr:PD-(D/E)XK nuclease family protein [Deltaproteobacteria bacterium]MBW2075277.1 PD-(D/E)XK nuclease family protein [Deltaproteobacteria bacterium]
MAASKTGWASPEILTLNAWVWKTWNMTWPSTRPLSYLSCLALWKEASSRVPPPEPFLPDLKLFQALDATYTVVVRHGLSPEGPPIPATPLLAWRREIIQTFEGLARDSKGFHPALLPVHLARAIQKGAVRPPEAIALAAFEAPAPIEEALFDCLASVCRVRRFDLPTGTPEKIVGVVMPNRKQEVAWLTRQLVMDASTMPLNRIGVVIPDTESYAPYVKEAFSEIMGKPLDQGLSAYNISIGTPLLERSLIQAGLLPLRFWVEDQARTLLLSIALSPYYGRWATGRDRIAQADRVWRKQGLDGGLSSLLQTLSDQSPELFTRLNQGKPTLEAALSAFAQESERTGKDWVRTLETFWNVMGFPIATNEADIGAWQHLKTILHRIQEDLKTTAMSLTDFLGVVRHLLSGELVHIQGSEEAGIQVLGIIESRGLSFEKLYILGLSAGSLPRPVRPLPFLDPWERQRVQGATAESQFRFAQEAFGHLLACARDVTLIRPEEDAAEPLAPSPFWAQAVPEETHHVIDLWNAPDGVWARAAWLHRAKKGLERPAVFPPADLPVEGHILPETVSVSQLSAAFACPFRFYAEFILKVFPLDELVVGISPLDRGNRLHKVLALFTRGCRDKGLVEKTGKAAMEVLLKACADDVLSSALTEARRMGKDALDRHGWMVEHRRWLGDKRVPGLLMQWLDLELRRLDEGWRWLSEESSFEGLTFPDWPFSIAGRIDRIDYHKDKGFILWDYKSGEHPSREAVVEYLIDPQIPAYVQAAKAHRVVEIGKEPGPNVQVSGGYITLKTPSGVTHKELTPKGESWDQALKRWQEAVASLGKMLASGQFRAEPYPASDYARQQKACQYCPYGPLCGRKEPKCSD